MDEGEVKLAELESNNLQQMISEVEAAIAASTPGTRALLENVLRNVKGRVFELEDKTKIAEKEKAEHQREEATLAALARQATALSAKEQETYGGFLKEEFFTKRDFGRLDDFYAHSWDRLSERGKDEMSHRVWEGIRHEEYTFEELPSHVREKETKRVYDLLRNRSATAPGISNIPERDRGDFIRAFDSGKQEEVEKVLQRDSFKESMFRSAESVRVEGVAVVSARVTEGKAVGVTIAGGPTQDDAVRPHTPSAGNARIDFAGVKLDGFVLADASGPPSSAAITCGVASQKNGPSLGSS